MVLLSNNDYITIDIPKTYPLVCATKTTSAEKITNNSLYFIQVRRYVMRRANFKNANVFVVSFIITFAFFMKKM